MSKLRNIQLSTLLLILLNNCLLKGEEIECNLAQLNEAKQLCNIYSKSSNPNLKQTKKFNYIKSPSSTMRSLETNNEHVHLPFSIDIKTGDLTWSNKHQPTWTRWSKLCPSPQMSHVHYSNGFYSQIVNYCSNHLTCDLTGICEVKFQIDNSTSNLVIKLRDNLDNDAESPKFTNDLSFLNITFDLDETASNEHVLIDNTVKLDSERSKSIRLSNIFQFDMVMPSLNPEQYKFYCKSNQEVENESNFMSFTNLFAIRFDANSEKLFIQFDKKSYNNLNKEINCFLFDLIIKRPDLPISQSSTSTVVVNLIDNRFDRPIFENIVYNFTIYENSPLDSLIGQVNAIYKKRKTISDKSDSLLDDSNQIKYRIVPNVLYDQFDFSSMQFSNENDDNNLVSSNNNNNINNGLPIEINQLNGVLTQKLNIDREKYLNGDDQYLFEPKIQNKNTWSSSSSPQLNRISPNRNSDGLIKINIESSYLTSMSYGYCTVNIFIKDINDNAPLARIKPIGNFGRLSKSNSNLVYNQKENQEEDGSMAKANFYVNENTPVNQIIGYVGVYDPDAGENGTIKSIDLRLVKLRRPSKQNFNIRKSKYEKLKELEQRIKLNKINNSKSLVQIKSLIEYFTPSIELNFETSELRMPLKINKIGEKLYTLQLINKLNFKEYESFKIELKIQDNGTIPQLESKTLINLNVIETNNYAPIFISIDNLDNDNEIKLNVEESPLESSNLGKTNTKSNIEWPVLFKAFAIDFDDDKNGQIKYTIVNNPFLNLTNNNEKDAKRLLETTFSLNEHTGELRLMRNLSRDLIDGDSLKLIIMAQDQCDQESNRLNATLNLKIRVMDLNNNLPKFESDHFQFQFQIVNTTESNEKSLNFQKIASSILITDLDTFETNSANFYNIDLNKTSDLIMIKSPESIIGETESFNKRMPKFIFRDEICLKTLSLFISDESSPFLFVFEAVDNDNKSIASVKCLMSIWLDVNNKEIKRKSDKFEFNLTLGDNGLSRNSNQIDYSKPTSFSVDLIFLEENSNLQKSYSALNKTSENTYYLELNSNILKNMNYLTEFKFLLSGNEQIVLKSAKKLTETKSQKFASKQVTDKFKLDGSKLSLSDKDSEGVYLLDLNLIKENDTQELVQVDLIIHSQDNQEENQNHILTLNNFKKEINDLLIKSMSFNNKNYFFDSEPTDNNKSFISNLYDGSSLIRFQSLLFGSNGDSFISNLRQIPNGHMGLSRILLSNRTSLIQFVVVTLVISFVVIVVFICCLFIIIKKNCSNVKKGKNDQSKLKKKKAENLNVTDDDIKNTRNSSPNCINDLNSGFTRIDVTNENDNSKDKVNRYLDGLDSLITSQHFQNAFIINQNQIELNENLNYLNEQVKKNCLTDESSSENNLAHSSGASSSSPSSQVDSKKSLIIPVNYLKSYKNNKNNINPNYTSAHLVSENKHSCTLSTTSSSLMSDEGCYGSSDFSSERDTNNAAIKLLKQQSHQPNVPIYSSLSVLQHKKHQQQQNYCINNLSRFEKLYNNKNELEINNSNIQVITSISGSYV